MNLQFEGVSITTEDDLRRLVELINTNPNYRKQFEKYGIKDEHIDVREVV